jgi:RNA polymerase sigma-70 factor (ECF subfamily)
MDDWQMIEEYWSRNEAAIQETDKKYGRLLRSITWNILSNTEDSEECVSDTYLKAWNSIPPEKPRSLVAFLGRIARNLAINRWHKNRAQKRYNSAEMLLSELSDCVPSSNNVEMEIEVNEISAIISNWLYTLSKGDRILFMRRYWYGDSLIKLAGKCGTTQNKLAGRMYRLRLDLKGTLEKGGVLI